MQRWEYRRVYDAEEKVFQKELNNLGSQGWKVIGFQVTPNSDHSANVSYALLERKILEKVKEKSPS
ncbi:MAG: hypothetical protein A3C58_03005 [Candidatus Staskawiczbacteria bacterium RIFCSPHIGHO2_02_FULL_34_10]|uniref:DUF4177 domain-containing protein n=2 Tax=Candidatus Staskawicziibacteriota TaxID=1817916 RepID=A0A1G2HJI7_9BACT|nr:MAG: hypothetical protein A2639_00885 [Candidatus Staskawiczbacteria bacterium RIFCSPHIGHO2_01_FULL_34_27]OGZ67764.1 MAG: hypothetical protein A3C58_03005 [Candidatus Staskawiczbacteria bacterium RIFCSPHIGHO2_02_FULL_34_10]